jgi:hypothetical protein
VSVAGGTSVRSERRPGPGSVLRRWPAALGLASAAYVAVVGGDRDSAVDVVCVAVVCYLSAAALGLPWVAWAAIPASAAVIALGGIADLEPWATLGLTSLVLVAVGLRLGSRPVLAAETAALVVYGGVAVSALALGPRAGAVVAGLALAAHAVWDAVHLRRGVVVPRSLAEACIFLDVPLGLAVVTLALV